jgi:hypothetical protein|tara:strand:+ start:634 stop:864 length:231 start_codon:yes stop_codon:yes gene_type:complete
MIRYQNTEDFNGIVITDGLLKQLHEMFPDRLPSVLVNEPEICKLIGQQQVVRWLQDKQDEMREQDLKGDNNSVTIT